MVTLDSSWASQDSATTFSVSIDEESVLAKTV
jgi:hypothetical protein